MSGDCIALARKEALDVLPFDPPQILINSSEEANNIEESAAEENGDYFSSSDDEGETRREQPDGEEDQIEVREEKNLIPLHNDNEEGTKSLYCWYWRAFRNGVEVKYKAAVFISHGLNEHMEWYSGLAQFLASKCVLAFGHDHLGFGRSEGERAATADIDSVFVADILLHVVRIRADYVGLPCFIYGHCIGGLFALQACLRNPGMFTGAIFEAPLLTPPEQLASVPAYYKAKLANYFLPKSRPKLTYARVTSDDELQARWEADPLRVDAALTHGMALNVLDYQQTLTDALDHLFTPFLTMHGCGDLLCPPRSSEFLRQKARNPSDGDIILFEGASHHLVLESRHLREQVYAETLAFIERKLLK